MSWGPHYYNSLLLLKHFAPVLIYYKNNPSLVRRMSAISYLFPLTKRARLLLKLDLCFKEMTLFRQANDYYHARWAIESLFEILQLIERVEIKMELYKEGERFPHDTELQNALIKLRDYPGKIGESLRSDQCLMALQKRFFQTMGACVFDAPSLHAWLSLAPEARLHDWELLNSPLTDLQDAVSALMKAYNDAFCFKEYLAEQGLLHYHPLPASSLLSVVLEEQHFVPEASFSPKAVFIKIWQQHGLLKKNMPFQENLKIKISEK
jgi:cell division protein ZapD